MAKLRLIERGLVEAAQGVDNLHIRIGRSKQKAKDGEEEVLQDEPSLPDETVAEFIARINLYVAIHLARAPQTTRDSHKEELTHQMRKDLIHEFLRACILKKCQNPDCGW